MNISGQFTTESSIEALTGLSGRPESLISVSTLTDVRSGGDGQVHATFSPVTALGRFVLRTTITTVSRDASGARLHVVARSAGYRVTADIALAFAGDGGATAVTWDAEVGVHGTAASVGQRIARDIACRVIGEVLAEVADVARQPA